ncbi:hypothetical protein M407DRAFT_113943 [Tulasnella calospora MUT 4182]|uniref:Uncharacterized protein n=1 Tax=Tulasnella calospora MUT 4182 TaxID=1051891 RepID=A0A0C3KNV3_9AGAM|nr:hypothetical protein M407DRAFT_113943 [Tulasnella calospora MUT 4182]
MHREVDDAIFAAREQHNADLLINSFPPERRMSIFQEVLEPVKRGSVKRALGAISLACRHWNRITMNSPALWTRWSESDGPEYLKRVRVLSKSRGLTIDFSIPISYQIWNAIKEEMYRITCT